MLFELVVILAFFRSQVFLWYNYGYVLVSVHILFDEARESSWLICQLWNLVHLEAFVNELFLSSLHVAAEYHLLDLVFQGIVLDHLSEVFYEVGTCVPFVVFGTFFIEPRNIGYEFEAFADLERLLEEVRSCVSPSQFGAFLQNELNVLLEALMVDEA